MKLILGKDDDCSWAYDGGECDGLGIEGKERFIKLGYLLFNRIFTVRSVDIEEILIEFYDLKA